MAHIRNNGRILDLQHFKDDIMETESGFQTYQDIIIAPFSTGIHDRHGNPIPESHLQRGTEKNIEFPLGAPQRIDLLNSKPKLQWESAVFIPFPDVFADFGHVLTEMAAWLGPLLEPEYGLLRLAGPNAMLMLAHASETHVERIAGILNLPKERVTSTLNMEHLANCRVAYIPEPSFINRRGMNEAHFLSVKRLLPRWHGFDLERELGILDGTSHYEKTYLSRSRMPDGMRKVIGEVEMEDALSSMGWHVVHPQELSIVEQLHILKNSRVIAGNIGSAFHLLMYFGNELPGKKLIGLGMANGRMNPNFSNQFFNQMFEFHHLCCLMHMHRGSQELKSTISPSALARKMEKLARHT